MGVLITALLALAGGTPMLIVVFLLFFPEKIEIWSSLLWKLLSNIKALAGRGRKRYIKHDIQGRVNEFTKGLSKQAPYLAAKRVQVQWT